jgi:methionyl-tRNA formyltransferase
MRMEAGLDTGPVMLRRELSIGEGETAGELQARLAAEGGRLIVPALDALATGMARFEPQDAAQATWAHKLEKSEARVVARPRALSSGGPANPWPIAETTPRAQLRI